MTETVDRTLPTVALGGRQWQVKELVPRQLRHIRRTLLDLNIAIRNAGNFLEFANSLSDEQYGSLVDVAYWGLTRGTDMSLDEFAELKIADSELFKAFFVIRDQSGLFTKASRGETGGDPGEAPAEMTQNQTGTTSS